MTEKSGDSIARGRPASARRRSGAELDVVGLDLGVERGGVHPEQPGGAGLVAAGLVEGAADDVDLEAAHVVVDVDAAAHVARACPGRARRAARGLRGVCDLCGQALALTLRAGRDDDRALD